MMGLDEIENTINRLDHSWQRANHAVELKLQAVEEIDRECVVNQEALEIIREATKAFQTSVQNRIASVVTKCLNAIFDEPYEFELCFESKRGGVEAIMVFKRDGVELDDPINEIGGGVVDVTAFALRLGCVLLARPLSRRLLVLDEPFKNLRGKPYRRRVRALLEDLAEHMGIQFVLNVDIDAYPEFALGTIVNLEDK